MSKALRPRLNRRPPPGSLVQRFADARVVPAIGSDFELNAARRGTDSGFLPTITRVAAGEVEIDAVRSFPKRRRTQRGCVGAPATFVT